MPLFNCSLSSLKRMAVTSAVHERLFSQVVDGAEHPKLELSEEVEGSKGTTEVSYVFDVRMVLIQNGGSYVIF